MASSLPGTGELHITDYVLPALLVAAPLLTVIYALYRYTRGTKLPVVPGGIAAISWLVAFAVVALLPLDLSATLYRRCLRSSDGALLKGAPGECHHPAVYATEGILWGLWRGMYWTTFALNWQVCPSLMIETLLAATSRALIPVLQGYLQSGQFTFRLRLRNAIKGQAIYFGCYALVSVLAMGYILSSSHFADWRSFMAFVMAAANCWGLILVLLFMGHGLVAVPRTLWRAANTQRRWRQVVKRAVGVRDAYDDAEAELMEVIVAKLSDQIPHDHPHRWMVDKLARKCPLSMLGPHQPRVELPRELDEKYLTVLHRRYKRDQRIYDRAACKWERLLQEGFTLQDELENRNNTDREYHTTLKPLSANRYASLERTTTWWWRIVFKPWLLRVLSVVCAALSAALLWSELTLQWEHPMLSLHGLLLRWANQSYGLTELVSIVSLAYMCVCAYTSLLRMRIFNLYALVPRCSDVGSMLFMGGYLCRLTVPLCYNYLNLVVAQEDTVFSQFMGIMDLVPFLGDSFNRWTPLLILLPTLSTYFNLSDRLSRAVGFGGYTYSDEDDENATADRAGRQTRRSSSPETPSDEWIEGQRIIQQARRETIRALGIDPRGRRQGRQRATTADRPHRGYAHVDAEEDGPFQQDGNGLGIWTEQGEPAVAASRGALPIDTSTNSKWSSGQVWRDFRGVAKRGVSAGPAQGTNHGPSMPGTPIDERYAIKEGTIGERIRLENATYIGRSPNNSNPSVTAGIDGHLPRSTVRP